MKKMDVLGEVYMSGSSHFPNRQSLGGFIRSQVTEGQRWRQSAADVSAGPVSELFVHIRVGTVTILCPGKLGSVSIESNVLKLPINPLLGLVWQVFVRVPVLDL